MIQRILHNAHKMKELIDETLKLAQLDHITDELNIHSLNLYDVVTNVLSDNSMIIDQSFSEVNCVIDPHINVLIDKMQIEEVFSNLISNAIKYCPLEKKCNIQIQATKENDMVKITFSDNGIGLTQDQKNHIFDKFYKGATPREGMESTGLGLTLCKNIIEKHGGHIWVESKGLGMGSTFFFTLPEK